MATSSESFHLKLTAEYWELGFQPVSIDGTEEPNQMPLAGDENMYWRETGIMDGKMNIASREALIQAEFQKDYRDGYSDGAYWYKILHFM